MTAKITTDSITLPTCPETERSLIAAVIDGDGREDRVDVISLAGGSGLTNCFEYEKHRKVWQFLCERHAAGKRNGLLEVIEGCREAGLEFADRLLDNEITDWFTAFGDTYAAASTSPVPLAAGYAREIRDTAERRKKILLCHETLHRIAEDRSPLSSWLTTVAEDLGKTNTDAIEATTHVSKFIDEPMALITELATTGKRRTTGIRTGLHNLDRMMGGLQPGRVTLIGGRTSQGKSALAVTLATQAALSGVRATYVSLEMPGTEVTTRVLSQMSGVPATSLANGPIHPHQLTQLSRAAARLREAPLRIIDDDNAWPSLVARLYRDIAAGTKLVFLDYLQLMQIPGTRLDQWQLLGRITAETKALALRAKIPIVIVAQLNREAAKESRPRLHHLRGSGDLEQDADSVILIHREVGQDGKPVNENADLMLEKNRSGETGIASVRWNGPLMRFEDWDDAAYQDDAA